VEDFYAAVGLADGSRALACWLEAGLPAISALVPDPIAFSAAYARALDARLGVIGNGEIGDDVIGNELSDVAYLRYPLFSRVITFDDATIVASVLGLGSALAAAAALGLLGGRRRRASFGTVAREAFTAFTLAFMALALSAALITLGRRAAAAVIDLPDPAPSLAWLAGAALALRAYCALSAFYAASGLAARLGLQGDHGRIEAARAALAWFGSAFSRSPASRSFRRPRRSCY